MNNAVTNMNDFRNRSRGQRFTVAEKSIKDSSSRKIIEEIFNVFLRIHKRNSERTSSEYKKRVEEFFQLTLGKKIGEITLEDIQSIKNKDVQQKFVEHLLNKKKPNKNDTITTKLLSVKSFFDELLKNDLQVNPMVLSVRLTKDGEHHNALTLDEYLDMLEFMKNEKDGHEKYLYSKLMFHTGGRKTATLGAKWSDFVNEVDLPTGKKVWVFKFIGKGKKRTERPISDEFYLELLTLKKTDSEYVFPELSSSQGAYKRYERSLKKYEKIINKEISIHTLKATAMTVGYQMTKDINLVKQLGAHKSILTTQIYVKEEASYIDQLSYSMSKEIDPSKIEKLTHKELLNFIKENKDIERIILMRLSK